MKTAAILTCFNRKDKTDKCLESLFRILPACEVYLTDDASTDGTREMILAKYPQVHVVQGSGNLFWSRGMYTAWKEAVKEKFDYYLWLNDDIELYPFFMEELLACNKLGGGRCIVTGLIEDFGHTEIIYGGTDANKHLVQPSNYLQEVTHMNGNVVLIPQTVVDKIGIIDPKLHHDLGDVDYGLTATEQGIKVFATRKPIAAGYKNNFCRVRKWGVSFKERIRKLNSPLGSPPAINFYFRRKHFGIWNATVYWLYLYVLNILPDSFVRRLFGDAYVDKQFSK